MRLKEIREDRKDSVVLKVFINAHGDPEDSWVTNGIDHNTVESAVEAAEDLFGRWTGVKYWRVMDSEQREIYAEGP
jgi:hypothetical protein